MSKLGRPDSGLMKIAPSAKSIPVFVETTRDLSKLDSSSSVAEYTVHEDPICDLIEVTKFSPLLFVQSNIAGRGSGGGRGGAIGRAEVDGVILHKGT